MKLNRFAVIILSVLVLGLGGCGSYYKISDPGSGKTYYTDEIKRKGASVQFKDANTGGDVTLQNSEVIEISKEEFRANTPKK